MDRSPFPYHGPLQADQVSGGRAWYSTSPSESSTGAGSERIFGLLPSGHQKTLRAVASGESIYGRHAQLLNLSPGTAQPASEALTGNGMLRRQEDRLVVVDPLLADWLQRRFAL